MTNDHLVEYYRHEADCPYRTEYGGFVPGNCKCIAGRHLIDHHHNCEYLTGYMGMGHGMCNCQLNGKTIDPLDHTRRCSWCKRRLRWNQFSQCQRCNLADAMPCNQGANYDKKPEEGMKPVNFWMIITILFWVAVMLTPGPWTLIPIAGELLSGARLICVMDKASDAKAIEPVKIDDRTQQEWYDLVKSLGREEFERISRPALDGLDDSAEGYGGWNTQKLLGDDLHDKLMREFYPEKFVKDSPYYPARPKSIKNRYEHNDYFMEKINESLRVAEKEIEKAQKRTYAVQKRG